MLSISIYLNINEIGKNIKEILKDRIIEEVEGKCIGDGFIQPSSIEIVSYSSGMVDGDSIRFFIMYECMLCNPVDGMEINCKIHVITKAGIHAEVRDEQGNVPIVVFVARDHHNKDKNFSSLKEGQTITVRVIGSRFELNDKNICVIATLH